MIRSCVAFGCRVACLGLVLTHTAVAEDTQALPSPLSLADALSLAQSGHPDLELAQARLDSARADLLAAQSAYSPDAYLELRPALSDPAADAGTDWKNDGSAHVRLTTQLYDFGRSAARTSAARTAIEGREYEYLAERQRRSLEAMRRFFDVILADLRYAVDNEAMAERYVTFDKGRERHRLGQISDVELFRLESDYQDALVRRNESQARQTGTRAQLALALNRPGDLPGELIRPALSIVDRPPPDREALLAAMREHNPERIARQRAVQSARAQLAAEQARWRPVLSAELEAARWQREIGSRDNAQAALSLRIPIYQGKRDSAAVAQAAATLHEAEARLARLDLALEQQALDLILELEALKTARQAARIRLDYRELALDRSRALYEMEVQTTLGDAMTRVTEAQWLAARAEFDTALTWAAIEALRGRRIDAELLEQGQ